MSVLQVWGLTALFTFIAGYFAFFHEEDLDFRYVNLVFFSLLFSFPVTLGLVLFWVASF